MENIKVNVYQPDEKWIATRDLNIKLRVLRTIDDRFPTCESQEQFELYQHAIQKASELINILVKEIKP